MYCIAQHKFDRDGSLVVDLSRFNVIRLADGHIMNSQPLSAKQAQRLFDSLPKPVGVKQETAVVNQDQQQKVRWRKTGGGSFRLASGKIIKQNQIFDAFPHEIPLSFRDTVVPIDKKAFEQATAGPEVKPFPLQYEVKTVSPGWYAVFDSNGKRLNDRSLRLAEAQALLEELRS